MDELRDERREPIVVAEANLVRGDRVVLVDDRHDTQPEQPLHGTLGVAAVGGILEVARGEQHLSGHDVETVQALLVAVDEHVLPHRRGRLLGREIGRPRVQLEVRDAGGDGPRGDQDDLDTAPVCCGQCVDQRGDLCGVQPADR